MNSNDLKNVKTLQDLRQLVTEPPKLSPYLAKLLRSFGSNALHDRRLLTTLERAGLIAPLDRQSYVLTFTGRIALNHLTKAAPADGRRTPGVRQRPRQQS